MTSALFVNQAELRKALEFLKQHISPNKPGEVCLGFEGNQLIIQSGAIRAAAPAQGNWDGVAWCSGLVVLALLEGLPEMEQVPVQFQNERLLAGNLSFSCRWDTERELPIALPIDASLNMILSLRLRYSEAEISRAGLMFLLRGAEDKRNRAIASAAKALKPLEISNEDLLEYFDGRQREQFISAATTAA